VPTIEVRGAELRYDQAGSAGDPTVLIHGSLVDGTTFARVIPGLARGLSLLTYDRRGYGGSTPGPRPRPVETDARDLAGLLEATDFYPVHVVGHSYGGAVALRLVAERPELVRSLSLHEPPFFGLLGGSPDAERERAQFEGGVEAIRSEVRSGALRESARHVVEVFSIAGGAWERLPADVQDRFAGTMERWAEEWGDPDAWRPRPGTLRETLVPTLLTQGTDSPAFLHRIRDRLAGELPNTTLRDVPHAGHAPHLTQPEAYVGILLQFLLERNVPVY
jgi:pimeloyl-ACP methyl ester carboxylesterase